MQLEKLHDLFGMRVTNVHLNDLEDSAFEEIRSAFFAHSVLVFPNQAMDDDQQIAFARRFGELETTMSNDPTGGGGLLVRISNVDDRGNLIPPVEKAPDWSVGNEMWHTDSSFKPIPAKASILSGRIVSDEGGGTGFATMRGAYESLPEDRRTELEGLKVEHSLAFSRSLIDLDMSDSFKDEVPPVEQPLIRLIPETGRKTLYLGYHASHILGWPMDRGRVLIQALNEWITQPQFTFEHAWETDGVVMWDNRCCLHRARPFDRTKFKRVMHRATVAGEVEEAL